ncbi:hypothetical protein GCM10009110_10860 [Psychrobacter piscatorii]
MVFLNWFRSLYSLDQCLRPTDQGHGRKASQAAAFLELIPIQYLNPFSKWYIHSISDQYMFGALYRHRAASSNYKLND